MARPVVYDREVATRLVEFAARTLAERGEAAVTVRAVAADAGVTTTAIYQLFGSKAGLLAAVHRAAFAGLAEELDRVPVGDDPAGELFELGLAYRRSALARPTLYLVMFGRGPQATTPHSPEDAAAAAATLQRLADTVARTQQAGRIPGTDPWPVTRQLWALVHGLASVELLGALGDREQADAAWHQALRAVFAGYRAEAAGS